MIYTNDYKDAKLEDFLKTPTYLFRTVWFENLEKRSKKPARLSIRLNMASDSVIFVEKSRKVSVVGFEDPNTGLFVSSTDNENDDNVYQRFREVAIQYAFEELDKFLRKLEAMSAEEYSDLDYKPISRISNELYEFLADRSALYRDLHSQVSLIESKAVPRVNERVLYEDDDAKSVDFRVTTKLPYKNPTNQTVTEEETKLVEDFLDPFLDDYNKKVLSWYFGAALSNVDIHDDRISKMLVVASSRGGSGKSSLINGLTNALFTDKFSAIAPSFDNYFVSNNRFSTGTLPITRFTVHSEADFCDTNYSSAHDFTGLSNSMIKSLITDGHVSHERKYVDSVVTRLHGLHAVLTNHPPVITDETEAFRRRFLPLVIKPTKMQTKAAHLDLVGQSKFDKFIADNAQAFANYFVNAFKADEYLFSETDYDRADFMSDINDSAQEVEDDVELATKRDTLQENVISAVSELAQSVKADASRLINLISSSLNGGQDEHVRLDGTHLYIDSAKSYFYHLGKNMLILRSKLIDINGAPVKKYQKRMIKIDLGMVK